MLTGIQITFTAIQEIAAVTGNQTALTGALNNPDFVITLAALANMSISSVFLQKTLSNDEPGAGSVYGPMDSLGLYPLIRCIPVFLLINVSISTQNGF